MSIILYISLGKIQKFPIYRGIAINLGKTKKKKGIILYIYKKPLIEKQLYKESGQSIKKRRSALIYRKYWGKIQERKGYFLYIQENTHKINSYIGILSRENLKIKSVYFPIYKKRKHCFSYIVEIWAKHKKKKALLYIYRKTLRWQVI